MPNLNVKPKKNEISNQATTVDVAFCRELAKSGCALNAAAIEDGCPICMKEWNTFEEADLAVVLPCLHAVCAPCLSRYRAECKISFETDLGEYSTKFTCAICRDRIRSNILYQAAQTLLAVNLVDSLSVLCKALRLPKKVDAKQMIIPILVRNHFDIVATESALFNLVCLSSAPEPDELDHDKKQELYETARRPVKTLQFDIDQLSERLLNMQFGSTKYRKTTEQISTLTSKLRESQLNAAFDIYERINSVDLSSSDIISIDFHGLHVEEAKVILRDYVLPVLPVLKKVFLITGRGKHSKSGQSILKESVRKYLLKETELKLRCEDKIGNEGVLYVALQ